MKISKEKREKETRKKKMKGKEGNREAMGTN